jgi:sarcosine oxidase
MTLPTAPFQKRIAVVGGGIMGAMTAHHLLESGAHVTLYDPLPYNNSINASSDTGRSFRVHYGDDLALMDMALESRALWKKMEADAGAATSNSKSWFHPSGKMLLADAGDPYARDCAVAMRNHGLLSREFTAAQAAARYGFQVNSAVLDPYGGILSPGRILAHLNTTLTAHGLQRRGRVEALTSRWVRDASGTKTQFDAVVVTAGAWTQQLLGSDIAVTSTRQQLVYFDAASALGRDISHLPVFSHMESGFYGIPTLADGLVKIANHHPGPAAHPDGDDRRVDLAFIDAARNFLARYHPKLAKAEIRRTHVCFYTGTRDRDFILDRIEHGPARGVIVGTGFSGHGFKFAPLIGRTLAELALNKAPSISIERFRSSRPGLHAQTNVVAV